MAGSRIAAGRIKEFRIVVFILRLVVVDGRLLDADQNAKKYPRGVVSIQPHSGTAP
jgi:hypothetical protein